MDALWSILTLIGSALCHQFPERSYVLGDLQMPLCARCIGIHAGFLLSSIIMWTGARRYASGMQSRKVLLVLAAVVLSGFVLALISYLGLGFDNNASRTISGLLIGIPMPFVVVPILNSILFPGRNTRIPLSTPLDYAMIVAAYALGAAMILMASSSIFLFYAVSVIGIAGLLVFIFTMVSLLVAILTDEKHWTNRKRMIVSAVASIVLLSLLTAGHRLLLPYPV